MKSPYLIVLFVLGPFIALLAQQEDTRVIDPMRYAPSPSASELGSYGQVPVGLFTGTPEVNVPLYELKTNNLTLPISLNYRSNGLVVDKVASNVGFDWSLFMGGVISRVTYGHPDDKGSVNIRYGNAFPVDPNKPKSQWSQAEIDAVQGYFEPGSWYYNDDTQPDMYAFNFAGYEGQFYIDDQHRFIPVPFQKLKIDNYSGASTGFEITTPDGVKYEFVANESTRIPGASGWDGSSSMTAFGLKRIVHPEGDEIVFYYKMGGYYQYRTGISDNRYYLHTQGIQDLPDCSPSLGVLPFAKANWSHVWSGVIDSVVVKNYGKIVVNSTKDRLDTDDVRITGFTVYDTKGAVIRSVELFHQFPYTNKFSNGPATEGGTESDDVHYRMFLDSIHINDQHGVPVQRYAFTYNDLDNLPIRLSYSQDHWGYLNGKNNNTLLPRGMILPNDFFFYHDSHLGNRDPDYVFAQKGILNKIVYPTGGYTVFDYVQHQTQEGEVIGGVRIDRQTDYLYNGNIASQKIYRYSRGASGAPMLRLNYYLQYRYNDVCLRTPPPPASSIPYEIPVIVDVYWLRSRPADFQNINLRSMAYGRVEVYRDENAQIGKEVHEFRVDFDEAYADRIFGQFRMTNPPPTNYGWRSGEKMREGYYSQSGKIVKEVQYHYKEDARNDLTQYFVAIQRTAIYGPIVSNYVIDDYFIVTPYGIISKWKYLDWQVLTEYDDQENVVARLRTDYYYDNEHHMQLSRQLVRDSKDKLLETQFKYTLDFSDVLNFQALSGRFILNKPIDVRTYRGGKLVSGVQTSYNSDGQPIAVFQAEVNRGMDIPFNPTNPYTFVHKISYSYNALTKALTSTILRGARPTTYLWSYKGTFPIAKIENATYSDVSIALSGLGSNFIEQLEKEQIQANINSKISSLRAQIAAQLPEANVFTYTYQPFVGMLSSTDANGLSMFYSYDDFGRLQYVRDANQNIKKAQEYYYVPPHRRPELNVDKTQLNVEYSPNDKMLKISSNGKWRVESNRSWMRPSVSNGQNDAMITITFDENLDKDVNSRFVSREGRFIVSDISGNRLPPVEIIVIQQPHPPVWILDASIVSIQLTNLASSTTFQLSANVDWNVQSDQNWLSVLPNSGLGNGVIAVAVNDNLGYTERNGKITITTTESSLPPRIINVRQSGIPSHLNVNPMELSFPAASGSKSFQISSNVTWNISEPLSWWSVTPTGGNGNNTATVTVQQNTGASSRSGLITVNDLSGGGNIGQVAVTQGGVSNYITVSPLGLYLNSTNQQGTFDISSNVSSWNTKITYITGPSDWLDDIYPRSGMFSRSDVEVYANQIPPSGQTWRAEIEVYNRSLNVSANLFVEISN